MKDIDYTAVGKKIRDRRKELFISQEELAEMCDVSTSYIGHIERGSRNLSMNTAIRISNALNVGLDYLFLDFVQNDDEIINSIKSALKSASPAQYEKFINILKILVENINRF